MKGLCLFGYGANTHPMVPFPPKLGLGMADDDKEHPPAVVEAMARAGQEFDAAAFAAAATPSRASRFTLLPGSGEKDGVLVFGGILVATTDAGRVQGAFNVINAVSFNRGFAADLATLVTARFNFTPDELAASKKRLKLPE